MRRILWTGLWSALVVSVTLPAWAADSEGGRFLVPITKRTNVVIVVYARPVFDGSGIASQQQLSTAAYRGVPSAPMADHGDYYRCVGESR